MDKSKEKVTRSMRFCLFIFMLLALTKCAMGGMVALPKGSPQTNLYYLPLEWDRCPCGEPKIVWGTNSGVYRWTNITAGTTANLSNLSYGKIYYFATRTNCSEVGEVQFPPQQPPWTNYATISGTGAVQFSGWITGPWMDATGRMFKLRRDQRVFWRTKARERISVSLTNNQVDYAKDMHRQ